MMVSRGWTLVLGLALAACGGPDTQASEPEPATQEEVETGGEVATEDVSPASEAPSASGELVVGEDACTSDADCVPAGCCHPAACVARDHAPSCTEVVCTTECRYGTLDCGGSCLCHEGHCAARLSAAPNASVQ
jgi:hypothetical protein